MRARWERLHTALVGAVTTLQTARQFRDAQRTESVLERFESAAELIDYLTSIEGDLDEKDRIYAALVRAVQGRAAWAQVANTVLWCGIWPALDRISLRRMRYFKSNPEGLGEAIAVAFSTQVGRMDLRRVHRVAATLVRSTDREVMDERRRERIELEHLVNPQEPEPPRWHGDTERLPDQEALGSAGLWRLPDLVAKSGIEAEPGPFVGPSFERELVALRARLLPVAGADTDLVLAVLVLDEDQRAAADRFGLTYEVARKRFQRALLRVREYLVH
jgi:hypothetical protein